MRFCAIIRSPASSNLALILPVRLRRVASGLIIENVALERHEITPVLRTHF